MKKLLIPFLLLVWTVAACATDTASNTISGKYKCEVQRGNNNNETTERLNVMFEIDKNTVKKFSSSWVMSSNSPDVRPGYVANCNVDMSKLRQTERLGGIVLKYEAGTYEKDQENCEIRIQGSKSSVQVSSSACTYQCLALNIAIDKNTRTCREVFKSGMCYSKFIFKWIHYG